MILKDTQSHSKALLDDCCATTERLPEASLPNLPRLQIICNNVQPFEQWLRNVRVSLHILFGEGYSR